MRNWRVVFVLLSFLVSSQHGLGEEMRNSPLAVVELFTSQGCSSCPPADRILGDLDGDENIIALAYHVNYWDYIGWPDTFGSESNSNFQRDYAAARNKPRIYTPQLMINGYEDVVGSRRGDVNAAISRASLAIPVTLATHAEMLEVTIAGQPDLAEAVVWLVTYKDRAVVEVERGENRGKTFTYAQIVTGRQVLGMWEPQSGARVKLPLAEVLGTQSDGIAIIVQQDLDGLPGRILGAASYQQ